jgi:hypothetical protein
MGIIKAAKAPKFGKIAPCKGRTIPITEPIAIMVKMETQKVFLI